MFELISCLLARFLFFKNVWFSLAGDNKFPFDLKTFEVDRITADGPFLYLKDENIPIERNIEFHSITKTKPTKTNFSIQIQFLSKSK